MVVVVVVWVMQSGGSGVITVREAAMDSIGGLSTLPSTTPSPPPPPHLHLGLYTSSRNRQPASCAHPGGQGVRGVQGAGVGVRRLCFPGRSVGGEGVVTGVVCTGSVAHSSVHGNNTGVQPWWVKYEN
ncbi:hypothetical protein E2C01_061656 [Portunus trituberculatus]|uniref:Uncharacterized protein n=1 Tax=Portunus trituberculatus TaxID=210409 RepID=A0A5B7HCG2_PORTR|nr:hypothetical protein [Portunus trituberculatus]